MERDRTFSIKRANIRLFEAAEEMEALLQPPKSGTVSDWRAAVGRAFSAWLDEHLPSMDHLAGAKAAVGSSVLDHRPAEPGDERRYAVINTVSLGQKSRWQCDIATKILTLCTRDVAPSDALSRALDKGLIPSFENALTANMRGAGAEAQHVRLLKTAGLPAEAMAHVAREALHMGNLVKLRAAAAVGGKPTIEHLALSVRSLAHSKTMLAECRTKLEVMEIRDQRAQPLLFDIERLEALEAQRMEAILFAAEDLGVAPGLTADDVHEIASEHDVRSRPLRRDAAAANLAAITEAIEQRSMAATEGVGLRR